MIFQHIYGRTEGGYGDYLSTADKSLTEAIKPIISFSFQGPDNTKESDYPMPLTFACISGKTGLLSRSCYETGIRNEMYRHSYIFTKDDLAEILSNPDNLFSLEFTENIPEADKIDINAPINYASLPSPRPALASIKNDLDIGAEYFSQIIKAIFLSANVGSRRIYLFHDEPTSLIRLLFNYLPPWIIEKTGFLTYDKSIKRDEFDPIDFRIKLIFVEDNKSNREPSLIKQKEQSGVYIAIPSTEYITGSSVSDLFMSLIQEAYVSDDITKLLDFYSFVASNTDKEQIIPYDAYNVFYKLFTGQSCMDYELREIYPVCGYDLKNSVVSGYINMLKEDVNSWNAISQLKVKDTFLYHDILNEIFSSDKTLARLVAGKLILEDVSSDNISKPDAALKAVKETYEKSGDSVCNKEFAETTAKNLSDYINPLALRDFEKYILSLHDYPKAQNDFFSSFIRYSIDLYLDEYFDAAERMKKQLTANLSKASDTFQKLLPEGYIERANLVNDLQQMQNERISLTNALSNMKKEARAANENIEKLKTIQVQHEKHIEVLNSDAKKIAAERETALYKRNEGKKNQIITRNNEVNFMQVCLYFIGILGFGLVVMVIGHFTHPDTAKMPAIFNICFTVLALAISITFGMQRKQGVHPLINLPSIATLIISILLIVTNIYAITNILPNTDTNFAYIYKNTFGIFNDTEVPLLNIQSITAANGDKNRIVSPIAEIYDIEYNESVKIDVLCYDDNDDSPGVNVIVNNIPTKYTSISNEELLDGLNTITVSAVDESGNESEKTTFTINKRMPAELTTSAKAFCQVINKDGNSKVIDTAEGANSYKISIEPNGNAEIFFTSSINRAPEAFKATINGTGNFIEYAEYSFSEDSADCSFFGKIKVSYDEILQEKNNLEFIVSTEDEGDVVLFTVEITKIHEQSEEVLTQ